MLYERIFGLWVSVSGECHAGVGGGPRGGVGTPPRPTTEGTTPPLSMPLITKRICILQFVCYTINMAEEMAHTLVGFVISLLIAVWVAYDRM